VLLVVLEISRPFDDLAVLDNPELVAHSRDHVLVVGNQEDTAAPCRQTSDESLDRSHVEMVGDFVQEEDMRLRV